jgi:hypothetical protein
MNLFMGKAIFSRSTEKLRSRCITNLLREQEMGVFSQNFQKISIPWVATKIARLYHFPEEVQVEM